MKNKSIAIDGPSGAGKSTISKKLADRIGFDYLDTGAMYRAYTYYYLKNDIDVEDEKLVNDHIKNIDFQVRDGSFYLNGQNVDEEIRSQEVTLNVSLISSYKKIRENLVDQQRKIAKTSNIILDGRDIGSHVLKDADMKFYLDAKPEIRAQRRYLQVKNSNMTYDEILKDIIRRDKFDSSREISPLVKADDAILIDSSYLTIDQVIDKMVKILEDHHVI